MSAVNKTEKEMFPMLQDAVPNGVKSLFYNEPVITLDRVATENGDKNASSICGYCVIQFKSTLLAVRALLGLNAKGVHFEAAFGPPKEPDPKGMIGGDHTSLIEGLMQVSTPIWRQEKEEEEKKLTERNAVKIATSDGEDIQGDNDEKEYPVCWVVVDGDTVTGYKKLHDPNPTFTLSLQVCLHFIIIIIFFFFVRRVFFFLI
ncbi:hypothetical protein RFI_24770 [Reticulomyxa filosa]|uniref:Uncharacterized protein n=1 Tax=Reticulomyxa filosa TaxID=46433 RepID=X6MHQ6_RETFI|nr:hypothetical protein RFI_24770 [Reticulomyxa filosa]|eukprot:ETO12605.1 hypothetical protein RFI_24770 [Reticulomyxa filosa]